MKTAFAAAYAVFASVTANAKRTVTTKNLAAWNSNDSMQPEKPATPTRIAGTFTYDYFFFSKGFKYLPVNESFTLTISSGVPLATTVPPPIPPSGPISMT